MTAQAPEHIILDGTLMQMTFCPPLPPEEFLEVDHDAVVTTSCWRGYIGTWAVRGGQLWLVNLTGRLRLAVPGPLLADWFSGVLRIPQGKRLHYVHMGFGSVYETEVHVKVEHGVVTERRAFDNRGREHDLARLGWENLPGGENRFRGDSDLD